MGSNIFFAVIFGISAKLGREAAFILDHDLVSA
jgi:hypothetical protein